MGSPTLAEACFDRGIDINRSEPVYGSLLHAAAEAYEPVDEEYDEEGELFYHDRVNHNHKIVKELLERGEDSKMVL